VKDMLLGLILGVSLGVQGHKLYLLEKDGAARYSRKELREKVTNTAILSCLQGVAENNLFILDSKEYPMVDCKAVGEKWGNIYK
jgi:hypothetical protein